MGKRGPLSPEHRAKISAGNRGKTSSPEAREKMSAAKRGKTLSPQVRAKMSAAKRGKTLSPQEREKISQRSKDAMTPEVREKISQRTKAAMTPEVRSKIGKAVKARMTPEIRAKMTGRKRSKPAIDFTDQKVSELPPAEPPYHLYYDERVRNLVLRIQPSGFKTWKTVSKGSQGLTLGRFPEMGVEEARRLARQLLLC
jgi:hypothetical protein